jgi:hypothetical protein
VKRTVVFRLLTVGVLLGISVLFHAANPHPSAPNKACAAPVPDFATKAEVGGITIEPAESSKLTVALAMRDRSMTLIAVCLGDKDPSTEPPILVDRGTTSMQRVGGLLARVGTTVLDYGIYPPTSSRTVDVQHAGHSVAHLEFPASRTDHCAQTLQPPLSIVECGSIVIADWQTQLAIDPSDLQVAEGAVLDLPSGRPLGFMFLGAAQAAGPIRLRFAFYPPRGRSIAVRLDQVYLRSRLAPRFRSALVVESELVGPRDGP